MDIKTKIKDDMFFCVLKEIKRQISTKNTKIEDGEIEIGLLISDFTKYYNIDRENLISFLSVLYIKEIIGQFDYNDDGVFRLSNGDTTHRDEYIELYPGDYTFKIKTKEFKKFFEKEKNKYNIRNKQKNKIKFNYNPENGKISFLDEPGTDLIFPLNQQKGKMFKILFENKGEPLKGVRIMRNIEAKKTQRINEVKRKINTEFSNKFKINKDVVTANRQNGYYIDTDCFEIIDNRN